MHSEDSMSSLPTSETPSLPSPYTHTSSVPATTTNVSHVGGSEDSHKLNSTAVGIIGGGVAAGVVVLGAFFLFLQRWKTRKRGIITGTEPAPAPDHTSWMAQQYRNLIGPGPRQTLNYPEPGQAANPMNRSSVGPSMRERHSAAPYPEWI